MLKLINNSIPTSSSKQLLNSRYTNTFPNNYIMIKCSPYCHFKTFKKERVLLTVRSWNQLELLILQESIQDYFLFPPSFSGLVVTKIYFHFPLFLWHGMYLYIWFSIITIIYIHSFYHYYYVLFLLLPNYTF